MEHQEHQVGHQAHRVLWDRVSQMANSKVINLVLDFLASLDNLVNQVKNLKSLDKASDFEKRFSSKIS